MNIVCPHCGNQNEVEDGFAGQQINCAGCGMVVNAPTQGVVEAEPVVAEAVPVEATPVEAEPVAAEPIAAEAVPVAAVPVVSQAQPALTIPAAAASPVTDDDSEKEDIFGGPKNRDDSELDMTPMVDVTFLLLIFFMVTASFALQKSISMPQEQSNEPSTNVQDEEEEENDLVTVKIDEFNSFTVIAAEFEREVPGKQNLIRALKEAKPESDACTLKVEVHENSVIEAVIDVMDAGAGVGFSEIQKTEIKDL